MLRGFRGSTATEYGILLALVAVLSLTAALVSSRGLVEVLRANVERVEQRTETFVSQRQDPFVTGPGDTLAVLTLSSAVSANRVGSHFVLMHQ